MRRIVNELESMRPLSFKKGFLFIMKEQRRRNKCRGGGGDLEDGGKNWSGVGYT